MNSDINNSEIHIYKLDISHLNDSSDFLLSVLSAKELEKAAKFKFSRDRAKYICSRAALKILLGSYISRNPSDIYISENRFGKPFLSVGQGSDIKINFNISHSENLTVLGFCLDCEIGVDVEKISPNLNYSEIAEKYFTSDEIYYIKNSKNQFDIYDRFFRVWTRKEALLKAIGTGLIPEISTINILQDLIKVNFQPSQLNKISDGPYFIQDFFVQENYKSAIAYSGKLKTMKFLQINF